MKIVSELLAFCNDKFQYFYPNSQLKAEDSFLLVEKELKRINGIVRNKRMTDKYIGDTIFKIDKPFVDDSEFEKIASDNLTAAYYAFIELREMLEKRNIFNDEGIKKYGYIISLLLHDVRRFANFIGKTKNNDYYFFNGNMASIEDSHFHYIGSWQLLYNCTFEDNMLDNKFAYILSPVALRQALELKIQRILGVADFCDVNGQKVFTKHHFFFDLIRKNIFHFNFQNENFKIIQKIFEFCNISVHKGVMPYYWQMHYAIKFCNPLFFDQNSTSNKNFNFHSSIKIKNYEELKNKIEIALKKKFSEPEYNLHIHWIKPEAEILN